MSEAMVWQIPAGTPVSVIRAGLVEFHVQNLPDGSMYVCGGSGGPMFMSPQNFAYLSQSCSEFASLSWEDGGPLTNPSKSRGEAIDHGASPFADGRDKGR